MAFQINRRPIAIDDVVGAKSWPNTMSQMADQLVAIYDCTEEFDFARRAGVNLPGTSSGGATAQTYQAWTIPSSEAWWIEAITANYLVPAGGSAGVTVSATQFGVTNLPVWTPVEGPTTAAGLVARFFHQPRAWFGPGTVFTVNVQGSGLAAALTAFSVTGTRVLV